MSRILKKKLKNHAARWTKSRHITKSDWTLVRTAGFEISFWATVRKTGSPLSHRKKCQDLMEGRLKDLGVNGIIVKMDLQQAGWEGGGLYPYG